jgi:hypothetical protein
LTKNLPVLIFVLFTGLAQSVHAQTYKVGDYVDYHFGGGGGVVAPVIYHCKVRSVQNGHYMVSCGARDYFADAPVLSPRAATAEDTRIDAEIAGALARQASRKGNSLGAQYGTREPANCASRTAPTRGAPSAAQARQYLICDTEVVFGRGLFLVTSVKVQVAPVSHPPNAIVLNMHAADINPREPVWDIRGSMTEYQCAKLEQIPGWPDGITAYARTHTCGVGDVPNATGYCYKNTFGDWHCAMAGPQVNQQQDVLPPEGY